MRTIKKYPLIHRIDIFIPKKAEILCVRSIDQVPTIFVEIDQNNLDNQETRIFGLWYTDSDINPDLEKAYVGTIEVLGREVHVFEILN